MSLPDSCYSWRYKLINEWRKHIKYFEYLYFKYMYKAPEISDNAARIICLLKEEIESLKLKSAHKGSIKPISYP